MHSRRFSASTTRTLIPLFLIVCSIFLSAGCRENATRAGSKVAFKKEDRSSAGETRMAVLKRIIDGDTIVLADNEHVRYIGMNTPEIAHGGHPAEYYGPEATDCNREVLGGDSGVELKLVFDERLRDRYGRLLAYVYAGPDFKTFVNEELLRRGCARIMSIPPDDRYGDRFKAVEQQARSKKLGLWDKE